MADNDERPSGGTAGADEMKELIDVIEVGLRNVPAPLSAALVWAEDRFGARRIALLLGLLLAVSFFCLILGYGAAVVSNAIGFAYPARETIVLMERPPYLPSTGKANVKWYTFWMTFVAVQIVERHLAFVPLLVPFYYLLKTAFLVWCFVPIRENGAAAVHAHIISRYLGGVVYQT